MRRINVLFGMLVVSIAGTAGAAEKNAVAVTDVALLSGGVATTAAGGWQQILESTLHTSQQKDLVVGVTAEAGLFTDTLVSSQRGKTDTSTAEARIEVRVLVDGVEAAPGKVTFASRKQDLMAKFGGVFQECTDLDGNGTIVADECSFTDEQLRLVLETMNANGFNFIAPNVGVGNHTVAVEARITTANSSQAGSAASSAAIGKGTVTVEEVRLANDFSL